MRVTSKVSSSDMDLTVVLVAYSMVPVMGLPAPLRNESPCFKFSKSQKNSKTWSAGSVLT